MDKRCITCAAPLLDKNKTGFCTRHRDRTGINNPFYGKSHSAETIENIKGKASIASSKLWENSEYRGRVIKGISKPRRESFKKEQSDRVRRWYIDNPAQKTRRSVIMRQSWLDGKIAPNINSINESKIERELLCAVKERLPTRNVRKSTIKINTQWFYPDIRVDKEHIIEFYGNFWHANPKMYKPNDILHHGVCAQEIWERDKQRTITLENAGYRVFIVWESDYKQDKDGIISNILSWLSP